MWCLWQTGWLRASGQEVSGTVMKLVRIWKKYQNYLFLPHSPVMTLANHPGMSELRQVIDFAVWQRARISRFKDLFKYGQFVTWRYLNNKVPATNELQYNQMRSMVMDLQEKQMLRTELNKFELMLNFGPLFKKTV